MSNSKQGALANADRCSNLTTLDLYVQPFQEGGVKFKIPELTKTRKGRPPIEVFTLNSAKMKVCKACT